MSKKNELDNEVNEDPDPGSDPRDSGKDPKEMSPQDLQDRIQKAMGTDSGKTKSKKSGFKTPQMGKNSPLLITICTVAFSFILTLAAIVYMCPTKGTVTSLQGSISAQNGSIKELGNLVSTKASSEDLKIVKSTSDTAKTTADSALQNSQSALSGIAQIQTNLSGLRVIESQDYDSGSTFTIAGNISGNLNGSTSSGLTGNLSSILQYLYTHLDDTSQGSIPSVPNLLLPTNGQVVSLINSSCFIAWTSIVEPGLTYSLNVVGPGYNKTWTNLSETTTTSWFSVPNLSTGSSYYWDITVSNSYGVNKSVTWQFVTL